MLAGSDEFTFPDATAQAKLVRRGDVTPLELIEAAIARIERLNDTLNAVVTTVFDQAREAAASGPENGPFYGVPFLLKDFLVECAGTRLTEGSAYLQNNVSTIDSELVKRFKHAGLIVLGKTNTPEFAIGVTTEPALFGPTRNPWDLSRTSGGSSGGSAAAVAAGLVPIAHGSDAGGSIRIPASCCGIFGLKPSRGRTPYGPRYGDVFGGLQVDHVLTRSVRDSAAVLDIIGIPDPGAPYQTPAPDRPFRREVGADLGELHVAFTTEAPLGTEVHADCIAAVHDVATLCTDLGHIVEEAVPPIDGERLWRSFTTVLSVGLACRVIEWERRTGRTPTQDQFEPFSWSFVERGRQISGPAYLLAVQTLQQISRDITGFLDNYDVLLTPTLGLPPIPIDYFTDVGSDSLEVRRHAAAFSPFTYVANVTGRPAMSVPLYWNDAGLPIGTQFVGRYGDEATLFRLAAQFEAARPWAQRWPAITAHGIGVSE